MTGGLFHPSAQLRVLKSPQLRAEGPWWGLGGAGVQASCVPGAEGGRSDPHLVSSYAYLLEHSDESVC